MCHILFLNLPTLILDLTFHLEEYMARKNSQKLITASNDHFIFSLQELR